MTPTSGEGSLTPRYRYHTETGLALLQSEGSFSIDAWERSALDTLQRPAPGGIRRILSDRRKMTGRFPEGMEDRALAYFRKHARALGEVHWAVVVPDNVDTFATVRLAAELSKGTRIRVQGFTDVAVALRWLLGVYEEEQVDQLVRWIDSQE